MFHARFVFEVHNRLKAVFPISDCYAQALATYAGNWWTFSVGSKAIDVREAARSPVDGARYYAADVHAAAFLPRSVLARVQAGTF